MVIGGPNISYTPAIVGTNISLIVKGTSGCTEGEMMTEKPKRFDVGLTEESKNAITKKAFDDIFTEDFNSLVEIMMNDKSIFNKSKEKSLEKASRDIEGFYKEHFLGDPGSTFLFLVNELTIMYITALHLIQKDHAADYVKP